MGVNKREREDSNCSLLDFRALIVKLIFAQKGRLWVEEPPDFIAEQTSSDVMVREGAQVWLSYVYICILQINFDSN